MWCTTQAEDVMQSCSHKREPSKSSPGCKQIPVKMAFDVKQLLKRKARLAARGDKTAPPEEKRERKQPPQTTINPVSQIRD